MTNRDLGEAMGASEADLVTQAKQGNRDAFVELLGRSGPAARQVVDGMIAPSLQSLLSSDDVMQQAYADAFLCLNRFKYDGEGSFDRWLTTLAKRNCVDGVRALQAAKRGGRYDRVEAREESMASLLDIVTGISATPSRFAAGQEATSALESAVNDLPEAYGKVVRRLDLEGARAEEVATELDRSVGAIYMLRARAHDRLAELMGSASRYLSDGA